MTEMTETDLEKLAPRSKRFAARLIDLVLISAACWVLALSELFSAATLSLAWMLAVLGLDTAVPGRSPGKQIFRIAVVSDRDGGVCSRWQALGRNFPLVFLPVLDWAFIFCRDRRRIGDSLCNTLVFRLEHVRENAAVEDQVSPYVNEEMSLQTVAVFGTMLEAEILRARLEADGIPAVVVDGNLVQAYSLIAIAVGGVRVQVMQEYAVRAGELVKLLNDGGLQIEG
ncbi:RDD family protein [Undibacterium sp. TJN25]|uniref:RDD family protein n=1 Tax=Undibacterium sp. TJN25 TaxID=3413056 RepID=UPI003BF43CCA